MADGGQEPGPDGETIGELIARLVDDGRSYAEAEIALAKAIVAHRAVRARRAVVALAIGWFFLFAGMTALVIGAMVALAREIGPLFAGIAVFVPLAILGYLLVHYGWAGIKGLGRDEGERAAIARRDAVMARARLDSTLAATRARLHPNSLAGEAWDGVKAKGADLADEAVEAVKQRPIAVSAGIGALALFLARGPLTRAAKRLISDRTNQGNESEGAELGAGEQGAR